MAFWGSRRLLVQSSKEWSLYEWPAWRLLDAGDGVALPEPGGDRLVAISDDGTAAAAGCGIVRVPARYGPVVRWAWLDAATLVAVAGERPSHNPHRPWLLPVPPDGPTAQPFGCVPEMSQAVVAVPLDGSSVIELCWLAGNERVLALTPDGHGGVVMEWNRVPLVGADFRWRLDLLRPGNERRDFNDVRGATAGYAASPSGASFAYTHSELALPDWPVTYVVHSDGAVTQPFGDSHRAVGAPSWAPDGSRLAQGLWRGLSILPAVAAGASAGWDWMGLDEPATTPSIALSPGGTTAVAVQRDLDGATAVYELDSTTRREIMPLAEPIAPVSLIRWRADGADLEGLLLTPDGTGPWPLVVDLHGGPNNGLRVGQLGNLPGWVSEGYAAFAPDHRGSGIAGREAMETQWLNEPDHHGGTEATDVLAGIDHLVDTGIADPHRLCLYGHSAGAWLAATIVTIDRRFRACITYEGIYHYRTAYLVRAANQGFANRLGGSPWRAPERWSNASPLSRVAAVTTPTLVLAGENGSVYQATAWWQALRDHGVTTEYFVYRDEGHTNTRPANQLDLIERSANWFRRHTTRAS